MKKIFQIFIIVALFIAAYYFRFELHEKFEPYINQIKSTLGLATPINPCLEPIPYTLGGFDTKFGISQKYFLSALLDAEAMWEKPFGKNMFDYVASDTSDRTMKVNLVYDYRQQATSKLASLGLEVENTKSSYESLKTKLDSLKSEYDLELAAFNKKVADFNQRNQQYENDVNYWNSKGGAPQNEYNKLQNRQAELQTESRQIQKTQNNLNNKVDEINALVVVVNRLIGTLNLSVDKYNTTNESRGESFEEGVYTSDGITSEIDIYEFSNREKLVRVLSHELGHSLGLDHVEDKNAIMYKLNQGNNLSLSQADIDALKTKCGI